MLIESNLSQPDSAPARDLATECVDRWQSELDQFISATMARLDALVVALEQCEQQEVHSISQTCHPVNDRSREPSHRPVQEHAQTSENLLTCDSGEGDSPLHTAASEQTNSPTGPFESPANVEPIPAIDPSPADADEAWQRLSAIKSRIAKQLENQ